jgi:HlyD family secretion protein
MNSRLLNASLLAMIFAISVGCQKEGDKHDASGVFEARETVIAAQIAGQIVEMPIEEGQVLKKDAVAAEIDCKQLMLQRAQIRASEEAIGERTTEAAPQLAILKAEQGATVSELAVQKEQRDVLERERERFERLVAAKAAPAKQLSDIEGQIAVLARQMASTQSKLEINKQRRVSYSAQIDLQNRATTSERTPTQARIAEIEDKIEKCKVQNPLDGTVLTKYTEQFEFATPGKPLYRIADLTTMTLRAYVTGDQVANIKLNQAARVFIDAGAKAFRELPGTLVWVSDKAEFTPKTIQTKSERSNLVYAVKIRVPNDGTLKIGMYAEVSF